MDEAPAAPRRPVIVTAAVVLVFVSGFANTALGLLILLSRYDFTDNADIVTVSLLGAGTILLGLLTFAVGGAVGRGSRLARLLVTIYVPIQIVLHIITITTTNPWDWSALVELVLDALVLVALWAPGGSRRFFAKRAAAASAPAVGPEA